MKVLFVVADLAIRSGGPATETVHLCNALSADFGHEVTLASWESGVASLKPSVTVHQENLGSITRILKWPSLILKLRSLMKNSDIVFVSGIWHPTDGLMVRLANPKTTPLYVRVCGMLEPYIMNRHPWRKTMGMYGYVGSNLQYSKGIIVNSISEAGNIKSHFKNKILVIPNGIPPYQQKRPAKSDARAILGLQPSDRVILYLGRVHPKKGLHRLLECLARFPKENGKGNLKLVVAGLRDASEYCRSVLEQSRSTELKEIVQFTGEVQGEMKEIVFAASDVFVLPSESEGLPNAVLESLHRGLPCIVTVGCNIPEIAEYSAGKVIDGSTNSIESSLKEIQENTLFWIEASRNALRLANEKFNMMNTATIYDAIIQGDTPKDIVYLDMPIP